LEEGSLSFLYIIFLCHLCSHCWVWSCLAPLFSTIIFSRLSVV